MSEFATWLQQQRQALRLTQAELARQLNYAPITIRKLEAGQLLPSRQLAAALANALAVPADQQSSFVQFARGSSTPQSVHRPPMINPLPPATPLMTPPPAPHLTRLPTPLTGLIDREQERALAAHLLRQSHVRLMTMTGPPGIGKTRLAIAVATALQAEWAQGVCFVPLAAILDPALLIPTIARTLGLPEALQGKLVGEALQQRLYEHLQPQQLLLLLDNFEQVTAAAAQVCQLLEHAPHLKILVTSRTLLKLYGEQEFPVPPLALPNLEHLPPTAELARTPAVALFVQRAQSVQPHFSFTSENASAITQICLALGGVPLALEMAAARVKWAAPQTLCRQLQERLLDLGTRATDLSPRQQSLRGAIEWSYQLLTPAQQQLFDYLGLFVGGCTAAALTALLPELMDVPMALQTLVEHSLLTWEAGLDGTPRYHLLEMIREYAKERLLARPQWPQAQHDHATYFLRFAEQAAAELNGSAQEGWLNRLEEEHDNLRAALTWCTDHDVDLGVRLAAALQEFWVIRGYVEEGRTRLARLLAHRDRITSARGQAVGCHAAGHLALYQGDYAQAYPLLRTSLDLYRQCDDAAGIATTLRLIGITFFYQGEYQTAEEYLQEALQRYRQLGGQAEIAAVLNNLGLVEKDRGAYDKATAYLTESLALQRALDNPRGMAKILYNLSVVAYWQGDFAQTAQQARAALKLYQAVEDKAGIVYALEALGMALGRQGDLCMAQRLLEEGLALGRAIGEKTILALLFSELGEIALAQGQRQAAVLWYRQGITLTWTMQEKRRLAFCLEGLAAALGPTALVVQLYSVAAALRTQINAPLPPSDRAAYEQALLELHRQLGAATVAQAWATGQTLPLDQAVAMALQAEAA